MVPAGGSVSSTNSSIQIVSSIGRAPPRSSVVIARPMRLTFLRSTPGSEYAAVIPKFITAAMKSQGVRDAIEGKATELATRANSLGNAEGIDMSARVVSGTRPQGRPYSNVESNNTSQEWGDRDSERHRILGRVAEENH